MENSNPRRLRAADTDRERVATAVQAAGSEGRLTLEEVEDRLSAVYATKFTDELTELTADLPQPRPPREFAPLKHRAFRAHLVVAVALSVLLIVRWAASDVPFFWPAMPMFWLALSLGAHARVRAVRRDKRAVVAY